MKIYRLGMLLLIGVTLLNCKQASKSKAQNSLQQLDSIGYYSDYYVFISDDSSEPLVVPIDINWYPKENGYGTEFKGWYGTIKDWPIAYETKDVSTNISDMPKESYEHKNSKYFEFRPSIKRIIAKIEEAPKMEISVPPKSEWVLAPLDSDIHDTYAFKASILIDGNKRAGWMLYERIRMIKDSGGGPDHFEAFYWMPLVVNGDLYHFTKHRDELAAVRWYGGTTVQAEILRNFQFDIIETVSDSLSKRSDIPKSVQILAPEWNLDIVLKSLGEQVGHGKMFPKGLAFYRQSMLLSTERSKNSGFGMMELILEDDR